MKRPAPWRRPSVMNADDIQRHRRSSNAQRVSTSHQTAQTDSTASSTAHKVTASGLMSCSPGESSQRVVSGPPINQAHESPVGDHHNQHRTTCPDCLRTTDSVKPTQLNRYATRLSIELTTHKPSNRPSRKVADIYGRTAACLIQRAFGAHQC